MLLQASRSWWKEIFSFDKATPTQQKTLDNDITLTAASLDIIDTAKMNLGSLRAQLQALCESVSQSRKENKNMIYMGLTGRFVD